MSDVEMQERGEGVSGSQSEKPVVAKTPAAGGGGGGAHGSSRRPHGGGDGGSSGSEGCVQLPVFSCPCLSVGVKEKVFAFFDDPQSSRAAAATSVFIMLMIVLSTITFILETLPTYKEKSATDARQALRTIEKFAISVFTVEYVLRLVSAPDVLRFVTRPLSMVDFLAIFPFYLELMFGGLVEGLIVIRVIRLARIFRIFKYSKYTEALYLVFNSVSRGLNELKIMVFLILIVVIVCSTAMYFAELSISCEANDGHVYYDTSGDVCRDINGGLAPSAIAGLKKSGFQSIPDSIWWCLVTITTVGYGDLFPISDPGRVIAIFTMFTGLVIIAFPITVIGTNFGDLWQETKEAKERERRRLLREEMSSDHQEIKEKIVGLETLQRDLDEALATVRDIAAKTSKATAALIAELEQGPLAPPTSP